MKRSCVLDRNVPPSRSDYFLSLLQVINSCSHQGHCSIKVSCTHSKTQTCYDWTQKSEIIVSTLKKRLQILHRESVMFTSWNQTRNLQWTKCQQDKISLLSQKHRKIYRTSAWSRYTLVFLLACHHTQMSLSNIPFLIHMLTAAMSSMSSWALLSARGKNIAGDVWNEPEWTSLGVVEPGGSSGLAAGFPQDNRWRAEQAVVPVTEMRTNSVTVYKLIGTWIHYQWESSGRKNNRAHMLSHMLADLSSELCFNTWKSVSFESDTCILQKSFYLYWLLKPRTVTES